MFVNSGYTQTSLGYGQFLVSYHGGDLEFCKKAGYYRCAELCVQQGFRYFKVTDEQVLSTFIATHHHNAADEASWQDSQVGDDQGLRRAQDVAGYNYKVEFYKADPMQGRVVDAKEILDTWKVPGKDKTQKELEAQHGN